MSYSRTVQPAPVPAHLMPDDLTVGLVSVGVDITHPSRSDLTLDLVAPSGVATRIYNGFGQGVDTAANLVDVLPATSALRGQAAQGTWYPCRLTAGWTTMSARARGCAS